MQTSEPKAFGSRFVLYTVVSCEVSRGTHQSFGNEHVTTSDFCERLQWSVMSTLCTSYMVIQKCDMKINYCYMCRSVRIYILVRRAQSTQCVVYKCEYLMYCCSLKTFLQYLLLWSEKALSTMRVFDPVYGMKHAISLSQMLLVTEKWLERIKSYQNSP
jgi:hypothetical protein